MAKQQTRFRVTPEMIDDAIKGKPTFTRLPSGKKIVCEVTLKNGFTVTGISSVVDLRNFNLKQGKEIALRNAKEAIYPFLGYVMQTELQAETAFKASAGRARKIAAAKTNPKTGLKRVTRTRRAVPTGETL